jgi:Cu-processing system permease protein
MTGALIRFDLAAARHGRTAPLFAAGFALASIAIALVGLSAGGTVAVQGFARTSISLLQLILWVVPLLALLTGAAAGAECYELEFIAALPLARGRLVIARWAAWLVALGAALLIGLGCAGFVIGVLAGTADVRSYVGLLAIAALLLSACLAVGLAIGVQVRSRARAMAAAILVWCVLVVGVDLLAIGLLSLLPAGTASWPLAMLLVADPLDAARVLGLGLFQADAIAGPTGAALRSVMGGWGGLALLAGLVTWTAVPLGLAARTLDRRDL